jgi:hypothetical protein
MTQRFAWLSVVGFLGALSLSHGGEPGDKLVGVWKGSVGGHDVYWTIAHDAGQWSVRGVYKKGTRETGSTVGVDVKYANGALTFTRKLEKKPESSWADNVPVVIKYEGGKAKYSAGPTVNKSWATLQRQGESKAVAKEEPRAKPEPKARPEPKAVAKEAPRAEPEPKAAPPAPAEYAKYLGTWRVVGKARYEEVFTIAYDNGAWKITGVCRQGKREVGSFHGEKAQVVNDGLSFVQKMDKKPSADVATSTRCFFTPSGDKGELKAGAGSKQARKALVRVDAPTAVASAGKKDAEEKAVPKLVPKTDPKTEKKTEPVDPATAPPYTEIARIVGSKKINMAGIAMSPDGNVLAIVSGTPTNVDVVVIEFKTKKVVKRIPFQDTPNRITWSRDGKTVAIAVLGPISNPRPSHVSVWDADTREQRAAFEHPGYPRTPALSADGTVLAVASDDAGPKEAGVIKVWDVPAKKPLLTLPNHGRSPVQLSADGKTLAYVGRGPDNSGQVVFADAATGKVRAAVKGGGERLALSADGNTLVATGLAAKGYYHLVAYDAVKKTSRVLAATGPWRADTLCLANRDRHVIVAGSADRVDVVNLSTGKVEHTFTPAPNKQALKVQTTPDGTLLLTYATDRVARLWTLPFGKE